MPTVTIQRLANICRQMGGQLKLISQSEFKALADVPTFSDAPFTEEHGVDWKQRIVYAVRGNERINAIIHEMGHIFADAHPDPNQSDEWSWFGWEIVLARKVDGFRRWSALNGDYSVTTSGGLWKDIRGKRRLRLIEERIAHAKAIGIVSENDEPLVNPRLR